ncbi:hypothetical protein HDU67_007147 [Dinochytrium kinnereticum]|nr:hypothetical protein HDU67_007147 [Dinochytrium kinnereticum]
MSSTRKRPTLQVHGAEAGTSAESTVAAPPPKKPRRSAPKATKRKKKQEEDDDGSDASSNAEHEGKKKRTKTLGKLKVEQMNQAFQDAVRDGRMSEAMELLDEGNITGASKKNSALELMRSERVEDLKQLIEKLGTLTAKILLNAQLKKAVAAETDLPVIKTILAATSLDHMSDWRKLLFRSEWDELWRHLMDAYASKVNLYNVPSTLITSLTVEDWRLLISKGINIQRHEITCWKNFINTPSERSYLELLQSSNMFHPWETWLDAALACHDVSIVRFLKNMGVPIWYWSVHNALRKEKIAIADAMIECGAEVTPLRKLIYEFSVGNPPKPASVQFLLSKGLKLSRSEMQYLLESPTLEHVKFGLAQGGNPMDFHMSPWRLAIKRERMERLQLFVDHGIDVNADKGYALFCACYKDNVELLRKLLGWGYSPIPEALEYAELSGKSSELVEALREALEKKKRDETLSGPQDNAASMSLGLKRTESYLKKESDCLPSKLTSTNVLETFVHTPAFFAMLQMLDVASVQKVRQACRFFKTMIPAHFFMEEGHLWNNLANGVEMDYAKVIMYKHQIGEIKELNRTVVFPWRGKVNGEEPLYNVAVLLEDKRLLTFLLKNMASTADDRIIDPTLLMFIPMSSLLTCEEVKSLLSDFTVSSFGPTQGPSCTIADYITAYEAGPLEALKYIAGFVETDEALMIEAAAHFGNIDFVKHTKEMNLKRPHTMMNSAASIAAERGDEEMVNALIRLPPKQGQAGAIISQKVVLSGNWGIVLTMLRKRFEFETCIFN